MGLVFLILAAAWLASQLWYSPLLDEGSEAPGWKLPLADGSGKLLELEKLQGKVVVIDFWSTTCPPCLREFEEIDAVLWQIESMGAVVVGIAAGGETVLEVREFKEKRHVDFQLVVDSGAIASAYRVNSLPTMYVIDKQGRISVAHRGFWDRKSIIQAVRHATGRQ